MCVCVCVCVLSRTRRVELFSKNVRSMQNARKKTRVDKCHVEFVRYSNHTIHSFIYMNNGERTILHGRSCQQDAALNGK